MNNLLLKSQMYFQHICKGVFFNLLYQSSYCKEWDNMLNGWLDRVEEGFLQARVDEIPPYTIIFHRGELERAVWVANKWYSYGQLWEHCNKERRPSIHTMIRLEILLRKLEEEYKINKENN